MNHVDGVTSNGWLDSFKGYFSNILPTQLVWNQSDATMDFVLELS